MKLPRSIWALGFVSLLMDVSSEIVHGLLPVFLVSVLGAGMISIGFLEGMAEAAALLCKVVSGPFSDWIGKRKPLVAAGYTLSALSKPFFAIAGNIPTIFGARLFDRIGKGIRGAPRDALVADLAPTHLRGRAFGLRQSLDTIGAFMGPLFAIGLMGLTQNNFRVIFWIAVVPGLFAVALLVFGVHEESNGKKESMNQRIRFEDLENFSNPFWFVVGVGFLFQLARFSEAFLILRAKNAGLSLALTPLVLIAMNIVYAFSSYPVGHLSDRIKREWFLFSGLIVLCLSDLVLGFGNSLSIIFLGITLWGLHMGLTQGTLSALVADYCSPTLRGTAFGIFNLFSAISLLFASILAGFLWERFGSSMTFFAGAVLALLSLVIFTMLWLTSTLHDQKNHQKSGEGERSCLGL